MSSSNEHTLEEADMHESDLPTGGDFIVANADFGPEAQIQEGTPSNLARRRFLPNRSVSNRFKAWEDDDRLFPFSDQVSDLVPAQSAARPAVVRVPEILQSRESFEVLQKFEGRVQSVGNDSFVAMLVDKTNPGPEEEAEIPFEETMPGDRELLIPGAVFYWVIGYRREEHGQVSRSSMIRFRRLPSWSPSEIERAKEAAETFLSSLDLERANRPA